MHNVLSHFRKRYQKMWLTEKLKKTFSFSIYPEISRKNYEAAGNLLNSQCHIQG